MVFGALYFMVVFLGLGIGAFYIIEKQGWGDPLLIVNQFMIYYLVMDLYIRYMLQKMPITNIKPLLVPAGKKESGGCLFLGENGSFIF